MKPINLFASLRFAAEGFMHVVRTHGHMRLLLLVATLLLAASLLVHVSRIELMLLVMAIALVVSAEILNSALETAVDLASPSYHPLAKVAKDAAGAGVLISIAGGLFVTASIFLRPQRWESLVTPGTPLPVRRFYIAAAVGLSLIVLLVVLGKFVGRRGSLTRGGVVSFHSALAFFLFASIWYVTRSAPAAGLGLLLALLVSQSRVEAGFHNLREVLLGALLALVVSLTVFQLLPG